MPESINATQAVPATESRCHHCAAFLNSLPAAARFCPRCGADLKAEMSQSKNSTRPWMVNPVLGSSAILAGYANALYSLGRRYESGGRLARNRNEAMRCYLKAARLGNIFAMARVPTAWLDHSQPPRGMPVVPPIPVLSIDELDG
jgi:TPR repeat protein